MKIKGVNIDKTILLKNAPYIFVWYVCNKIVWLYRSTAGDSTKKMQTLMNDLSKAFDPIWPSFQIVDVFAALCVCGILLLYIHEKRSNSKNFRIGKEFGSARWGNKSDIDNFMSDDMKQNIILTASEGLSLGKPKAPKFARNFNIMVIGSSGSGKTRFFVKPQLMQLHSSYVVTDPKGTVLIETGKLLQMAKYKITILNTINFSKSMHYNPFWYISPKHPEQDILSLVNVIIENTKGEGEKSGEDFWIKSERLIYTAYIAYMYYEMPIEDRTFATLSEMIDESDTKEEDEDYKNAIDVLFEKLEKRKPDHFAVRQYKKYKLAAGKTAKSIMISCGARLAPFDIKELRELTRYDEMELDKLGDRKTAMFLVISDTDDSFNFLVAIMYSQLFRILCERADDKYGGKLPMHVRCLIDEAANIGKIPRFEKLIATIRSRNISAAIILQAKSQLKTVYKDAADTIEGNCDTLLFLGGKEKTTLKDMTEMLGKETIDYFNPSDTKGTSASSTVNYQKSGKDLLSADEISVMDNDKCIMQIRGVRSFFSNKYDITTHPNYKYLSDYDPKNTFDIERYVKNSFRDGTRLKMNKDTLLNVVDVGTIDVNDGESKK